MIQRNLAGLSPRCQCPCGLIATLLQLLQPPLCMYRTCWWGCFALAVFVSLSSLLFFSLGVLVSSSSAVSSAVSSSFSVGPRALPGAVVGFAGVRSLAPSAAPLVASLVGSVLAGGRSVVSGCAVGADAAAVSAALSAGAGARLGVLCAFGPSGAGRFGRSSAPAASLLPVVAAGGRVSFWAGGGPSVPGRARLVRRSLAFVSAVAASGSGRGLVAFVGAPPPSAFGAPGSSGWPSCGSGSWGSVGAAALRGVPVVVFPLAGWPAGSSLPLLPGPAGSWVPAASSGVWSGGWRWSVGG